MDKERKHKRLDLGAYSVQHRLDEEESRFDRKGRCVPEVDVSYMGKCWVAMDIDTLIFFALARFQSDHLSFGTRSDVPRKHASPFGCRPAASLLNARKIHTL